MSDNGTSSEDWENSEVSISCNTLQKIEQSIAEAMVTLVSADETGDIGPQDVIPALDRHPGHVTIVKTEETIQYPDQWTSTAAYRQFVAAMCRQLGEALAEGEE